MATVGGYNVVVPANADTITDLGATSTTTILASGSNSAAIVALTANSTANITAQNLILDTTGGAIGSSTNPLAFVASTLNGFTTGTVNTVAQSGGTAFLTSTLNGITVGSFTAGTGNVTLKSLGLIASGTGVGSSIISASPNSGTAALVGNVVTLDTSAATASGTTGQIGYFTTLAEFFEVQATTLNATTNNSHAWISAINGATVGTVNVGTDTAILKTVNGNLLGSHSAGTPDAIAGTKVVLIGTNGGFGTATGALQFNSPVLSANVTGVTTGTGNIYLTQTNAAGLTVTSGTTTSGVVFLSSAGPVALGSSTATGTIVNATGDVHVTSGTNLTIGTSTSTGPIVTTLGQVVLSAPGSILSATPLNVLDIVGTGLSAAGVTGVGTVAAPLDTAVALFTGSGGSGGVFVTNTTALALNAVTATGAGNVEIATSGTAAGLNLTVNGGQTVSTGTGVIDLSSADNLTVSGSVTTSGVITLAGAVGNPTTGTTIALGSATALSSTSTALIEGNSAADTFNLKPQTNAALSVTGGLPTTAPGDALDLTGDTGTTLTSTGVGAGNLAFTNGDGIAFTGIETLNPTTSVAVTLNLATLGFQQGSASPDVVSVSTAGGVLNVTVQENSTGTPVSVYSGNASGVSSLTLTGSTDMQTFYVDETNGGLPPLTVNGTGSSGETLVVNTTNTTSPGFTPNGANGGTFTFGNRSSITYTGIQTVANAIVGVTATVSSAGETGVYQAAQPGTFTFTRTGTLSAALTVHYTVGGTAVSGVNYQTLSGQVTFAAGATTATVTVSPIHTSVIGGALTVTVTVAAGSGYAFASGASATVSIANNNSQLESTFAVASSSGVTVYRNGTPIMANYNPGFTGPISIAVGDVNGDGTPDIVMAGIYNGSDTVAVFDGATLSLMSVFVVVPGYTGGVSLAVGDVRGIGRADIVIGLSTVSAFGVFDGLTGALIVAVDVFPGVNVGVNVAVADLTGTGTDQIVVTPTGLAPLVSIYNGSGNLLKSFYAFNPALAGVGLTVAAGDLQGTGTDEIVLGVQVNGFDYVVIYNSNLTLRGILPLAPAASSAPPQVAVADANGNGLTDLLVTDGAIFAAFDGRTLGLVSNFTPFPGQTGGVNVG